MSGWLLDLGAFAIGVVMLIVGGDTLVRGAVGLAARLGVPAFIIGLTVIAFGTSSPELALNIAAALNDNSDLSFGNIVGSNIANIGLIMGVSALVRPMSVHSTIIKRELPIMVCVSVLLIAQCYLPPHAAAGRPGLSRPDAIALLVGFALFCLMLLRSTRSESALEAQIAGESQQITESGRAYSVRMAVTFTLAGLGALALGGRLTESGAVSIATRLGLSSEIIGLTIVAVATSLPELAASLAAALKGHSDLAVGNIVGSNIFNILLVLGATAMVSPVVLPGEGAPALVVMLVFAAALVPISLTKDNTVSRVEGGALLAAYIGFMGWQALRALQG